MRDQPALEIGSLLFGGFDQIDLTGPFEMLSGLTGARPALREDARAHPRSEGSPYRPGRDGSKRLRALTCCASREGRARKALMDDEAVLDWLRAGRGGPEDVLGLRGRAAARRRWAAAGPRATTGGRSVRARYPP